MAYFTSASSHQKPTRAHLPFGSNCTISLPAPVSPPAWATIVPTHSSNFEAEGSPSVQSRSLGLDPVETRTHDQPIRTSVVRDVRCIFGYRDRNFNRWNRWAVRRARHAAASYAGPSSRDDKGRVSLTTILALAQSLAHTGHRMPRTQGLAGSSVDARRFLNRVHKFDSRRGHSGATRLFQYRQHQPSKSRRRRRDVRTLKVPRPNRGPRAAGAFGRLAGGLLGERGARR